MQIKLYDLDVTEIRSSFELYSDRAETSNLLLKVIAGFYGDEAPIDVQSLNSFIDIFYDALACAIVNSEDGESSKVLDRFR